ncbi:ead/Ea22-like family protein [Pseudomonas aeruginosa]
MTDHAELRRLAKAATPGPWTLYVPEDYQGPEELPGYGVECAEGRAIVWGALEPETGCQFDRDAEFIAAANPKTILALLDEIDGMKASGWRNHSVNYARAEKCPQTLETAQAAWDRDQELIEEQRQQIARDSQTINQLRQKLQSAEVDRDRLKAENEALRGALKPFAEFERVRSAMGGNAPREGILYGVHSNTGSAELHVEHMQAAQSALEGATQ